MGELACVAGVVRPAAPARLGVCGAVIRWSDSRHLYHLFTSTPSMCQGNHRNGKHDFGSEDDAPTLRFLAERHSSELHNSSSTPERLPRRRDTRAVHPLHEVNVYSSVVTILW